MFAKLFLQLHNAGMALQHHTTPQHSTAALDTAPRKRGRPPTVGATQVCMTLRLSVADRDLLRALGGTAWLREQLDKVRQQA